jgi:hypothetical protein
MKCPNCKLINPESARRCDCGYDFTLGKLESSYLKLGVPKEVKQFKVLLALVAIVSLGVIAKDFIAYQQQSAAAPKATTLSSQPGTINQPLPSMNPAYVTALYFLGYNAMLIMLYVQVLKRSNAARILLMILTFPIGLLMLGTSDAKTYCSQKVP